LTEVLYIASQEKIFKDFLKIVSFSSIKWIFICPNSGLPRTFYWFKAVQHHSLSRAATLSYLRNHWVPFNGRTPNDLFAILPARIIKLHIFCGSVVIDR